MPLTSSQRSRAWQLRNPHRLPTKTEKRAYDRNYTLRIKYGITTEDYDRLLADQDGKCAICLTDKPSGRSGVFHVDHSHGSGIVRGLLCFTCNMGLGALQEDPEVLRRAIEYLCTTQVRRTA